MYDCEGSSVIQCNIRDITARRQAEEKIIELAFFDPLTHLPNRTLLMDRLKQAEVLALRNANCGAVLFIDLDHFKKLNDSLGHDKGDLLQQQVAQRLTTSVRVGDTVARLGGDEFVVLLESLHASLQEAAAQTIGRNGLQFFDPDMQTAVLARVAMEQELRNAIHNEQLVIYFQAQVVGTGRVTGCEALVRWKHHYPGAESGHGCHRRRCGDAGAARLSCQLRLPCLPGLFVQQTDAHPGVRKLRLVCLTGVTFVAFL